MSFNVKLSFALGLLLLQSIVQTAVAVDIPKQLPAPDSKPPSKNKPVKVYILAGQSNMVGIGQVSGGTVRWSGVTDAKVSVYKGDYSPESDYDKLEPIKTVELPYTAESSRRLFQAEGLKSFEASLP